MPLSVVKLCFAPPVPSRLVKLLISKLGFNFLMLKPKKNYFNLQCKVYFPVNSIPLNIKPTNIFLLNNTCN